MARKKPIKLNLTSEEQQTVYNEMLNGKNQTLRRRAKIIYYASLGADGITDLVTITGEERHVIKRALKIYDDRGINCIYKRENNGNTSVLDTIESELIKDFTDNPPSTFTEAITRIKADYNISITRLPLARWLNRRGIYLQSQKQNKN